MLQLQSLVLGMVSSCKDRAQEAWPSEVPGLNYLAQLCQGNEKASLSSTCFTGYKSRLIGSAFISLLVQSPKLGPGFL